MKLVEALKMNAENPASAAGENVSVALVCGFTPLHLQTFLTAELLTVHPTCRVEVVTGAYDDIIGSLMDLRERDVDAVALVLEWPDIDPRLGTRQLGGWSPQSLPDIVDRAQKWLAQVRTLLESISQSASVVVSLPTLPLPPLFFSASWQAGIHELQLKESLYKFASELAVTSRIRVVSEQSLSLSSPVSNRLDIRTNWLAGFPYQMAHASALAELLCRGIQNAQPKKGLITDLDRTLWSGIVGEDGPSNVYWDLDHHAQGHGLYQQFLSTLAQEGVLIGVASKNDPAVVAEAFTRQDILLARERIFPLQVSWSSKADAVSRVLGAWNVHAGSVIFVDDDPLELAQVKVAHPAMECVQFPAEDPRAIYDLIARLRDAFGRNAVSHEDEIRLQSLRAQALAATSDGQGEAFSEVLLEDANGELTFEFRKDVNDPRPLELINKTNQFNLNGKRFTEATWTDYLKQDDTFVLTSSYKDKFGALGKIAVLAGRIDREQEVVVDTWVLSCRAFGRRIEHHCLQVLFQKFGARTIRFAYEPTERNKPITRCLSELLDTTPVRGTVLSAPAFQGRCPKLFHHVNMDGIDNG